MTRINNLAEIPYLGSGLGYRRELRQHILNSLGSFDCLEIITDQFVQNPRWIPELESLVELFKIIPHGIGLSVGSLTPLDKSYLEAIKRISDLTGSSFYSEHLCFTRVPGIDIGHLSPLWFTEEVLSNAIGNVNRVQDYLGKPLILENVTYLVEIPHATMLQAEFFNRLIEATDCGILLDVTNVYINAVNHSFDPIEFLLSLPLDRIVQVHIAGGYWDHGVLVDGHSEPVQKETWDLLSFLAARSNIKCIILEHDDNYPEFNELANQVAKAKKFAH